MRCLCVVMVLLVLTISAAGTLSTLGDPNPLKPDFTRHVKSQYTYPDSVGEITPEWYYQKEETTQHVTPLLELAGRVDMDAGLDCSIRGAFMEWAAEVSGHHAVLCLKKTGDNNEGGWETHTYLKLDYPYQSIKGKHVHTYCYYDTLDGYTLILDSNPDWEWFDNPTLVAETLDEFIYGIKNDLGLEMDYEYEFYWWERPEMIESMHKVQDYQHTYSR